MKKRGVSDEAEAFINTAEELVKAVRYRPNAIMMRVCS